MLRYSIILLLVFSCAKKNSKISYGKTSTKELMSQAGEPIDIKKNVDESILTYVYNEDEKYQIEDDVVTAHFRTPMGDEKSLQYWKHKYKDQESFEIHENESQNFHPDYEVQYQLKQEGLTLIYHTQKKEVLRVVEHESEE